MKSKATIRKHIRELRNFIDRPTSADSAPENIISKRMAYCVETVLRFEIENTIGWRRPLVEVIEESQILVDELMSRCKRECC